MPRTVRAMPLPACAAGFAARHVHVIDVADLADRREAGVMNAANFAGRQFHQRVTGFAVAQRRLLSRAPRNLSATARRDLDVVNVRSRAESRSAEANFQDPAARSDPTSPSRQSSGHPARGCSSSRRPLYLIRAMRAERFGSYSIADHFRRDAVLAAFEIDLAILLLVTAADVTRGQPAVVVPAAAAFLHFGETLMRLRLAS